jgi:urease alpha subunit
VSSRNGVIVKLLLSLILTGAAGATGFLLKEDRADTKGSAKTALALAQALDRRVTVLEATLSTMSADVKVIREAVTEDQGKKGARRRK